MKTYAQILESLDQKIRIAKAKTDILENAKLSKSIISKKDAKLLNKSIVLNSEEIALILEVKSKSRNSKGLNNYQPILIDNPSDIDNLKEIINDNIRDSKSFHFDMIVKSYVITGGFDDGKNIVTKLFHCTPLQIDFDGKNLKLFYIDAAGDTCNIMKIYKLLGMYDKEVISHQGNIQNDSFSCSIFSIQNLSIMSNIGPRMFTEINLEENNINYDIKKLNPVFLKTAQSMTTIKSNLEQKYNKTLVVSRANKEKKKEDKTLEEYIDNYLVTVEVANKTTDEIEIKQQNHAIDYKMLKYLKSAKKELEDLYSESGENLVQETIAKRRGGIIFEPESSKKSRLEDIFKQNIDIKSVVEEMIDSFKSQDLNTQQENKNIIENSKKPINKR